QRVSLDILRDRQLSYLGDPCNCLSPRMASEGSQLHHPAFRIRDSSLLSHNMADPSLIGSLDGTLLLGLRIDQSTEQTYGERGIFVPRGTRESKVPNFQGTDLRSLTAKFGRTRLLQASREN